MKYLQDYINWAREQMAKINPPKEKTIELPDYWIGLIDEETITVNLTSIGSGTLYVKEIINNTVIVGGTAKEYFFTVYGERKDVDKLLVEY
jgi:hypothetical protein